MTMCRQARHHFLRNSYANYGGCSHQDSELQIRGGIEDNSRIIFLINEKICCDPSLESSRRDGYNDRSQHMFKRGNMENYS